MNLPPHVCPLTLVLVKRTVLTSLVLRHVLEVQDDKKHVKSRECFRKHLAGDFGSTFKSHSATAEG